jgi:hypothetical protein
MAIFLFLRHIILVTSDKDILKYSLYGFYFVILFSIVDIVNQEYRIKSLFSEPSHLGQYLVFIIFPILIINIKNISRIKFRLLIFIFFLLLLLTYSSTAFIKLLLLLIGYIILSDKVSLKQKVTVFIIALILSMGIYYYLFIISPNNYMTTMITYILRSKESGADMPMSVVDRGVFWYILSDFKFTLHSIFGYGLGGDSIHYTEFLDENIANRILSVKQFGFSIDSMMAKLFISCGIVGFLFYLLLIYNSFKILKNINEYNFLKATLFAIFIYMLMGMGNFAMIENWFWLAFIDAKVILKEKDNLCSHSL